MNSTVILAILGCIVLAIICILLYKRIGLSCRSTTGEKVIVYTHQHCTSCAGWFRFRHDLATDTIVVDRKSFRAVCPYCGHGHTYNSMSSIPSKHLTFKEYSANT